MWRKRGETSVQFQTTTRARYAANVTTTTGQRVTVDLTERIATPSPRGSARGMNRLILQLPENATAFARAREM
jgi:hypothetical protein